MKPGQHIVALLLWAGMTAHASSASVVGPGGIAAAPVQTAEQAADPERPAPGTASPASVSSVRFTVQGKDNAPISGAKVKVSKGMNGNAISTRTNDRGIATFNALPAVEQGVNVTAEGYVSYVGTADLRKSKTEFQIKLEPR